MSSKVKVLTTRHDNQSSIVWTHMVKVDNQLPQHRHYGTCRSTYLHMDADKTKIKHLKRPKRTDNCKMRAILSSLWEFLNLLFLYMQGLFSFRRAAMVLVSFHSSNTHTMAPDLYFEGFSTERLFPHYSILQTVFLYCM